MPSPLIYTNTFLYRLGELIYTPSILLKTYLTHFYNKKVSMATTYIIGLYNFRNEDNNCEDDA